MPRLRRSLAPLLALLLGSHASAALKTFSEGDCSLNGQRAGAPCAYGLKDDSGRIVVPAKYASISKFQEGLAIVRIKTGINSSMAGYIDEAGRPVIPPSFDAAGLFSEGYAKVLRNGLWGYIDKKGVAVLPYRYESAGDFNQGRAPVAMGQDRHGLIDITGRELVPLKFRQVQVLPNGLVAVANDDDEWSLVDRNGRDLTPRKYSGIGAFQDGLAVVNVNGAKTAHVMRAGELDPKTFQEQVAEALAKTPKGKFGFINAQGQEVVPPRYDQASAFENGYARVLVKRKGWGLVDASGREVVAPAYDDIEPPENDLIRVHRDDKGWGLMDMNGREILAPAWISIGRFSEGLATVCQPVKKRSFYRCGYVDRSGKLVLPVQYAMAGDFQDGMASVCNPEGTLCGYIDRQGKEVIPLRYTTTRGFSEGLNAVQLGEEWGYIDRTGKDVIPPQFSHADDFRNGRAYVAIAGNAQWPGEKFFIDRQGNYLSGGTAYGEPGALEYNVGISFLNRQRIGTGIPWIRQAAGKGYPMAMHIMGLAYANGEGVPANPALARQWLTKARDKGVKESGTELARLPQAAAEREATARAFEGINRINDDVSAQMQQHAEEARRKNEEIERRTRAELEAILKKAGQ